MVLPAPPEDLFLQQADDTPLLAKQKGFESSSRSG